MTPQIEARVGTVPLRVKLLPKAAAKSHRPERALPRTTCPIVGAGKLGELFVKGTAQGLRTPYETIESDDAERVVKELSSVEVIEPITPTSRRRGVEALDILRRSPRRRKGFLTRVSLFDFGPIGPDRLRAISSDRARA